MHRTLRIGWLRAAVLGANDWADGGWNADETVELCRALRGLGGSEERR